MAAMSVATGLSSEVGQMASDMDEQGKCIRNQ
jgi:hypothetical protein